MDLTLLENVAGDSWDRFAAASPHGSIFVLSPFLDALGEEIRRSLVVDERGEPLAGVVQLLRGGQPYPGQYPLTMYQGILLAARVCHQPVHSRAKQTLGVLEFLLAELEKRWDRVELCQHPSFEDLRGFSWFHYHEPERGQFRTALRYSGVLDLGTLDNLDEYLSTLRTVRRQEYRRCQAGGFCVRPSQDLEQLDRLHRLTWERQGLERDEHEAHLIQSVARAALEQGFGELLTCVTPDGAVASATVFLFDQTTSYYWVAVNDPTYRKTNCATYLMIENLRRCRQKGLRAVDMVGMNSPNRGDFKTSFNARPVPYFELSWEKPCRPVNVLSSTRT